MGPEQAFDNRLAEWTEPEIDGPGRTAHHEAGHAVMAISFGFPVLAVSTRPADTAAGNTWIVPPPSPSKEDHVKLALVASAGIASEVHFCRISGRLNAGFIGHISDQRVASKDLDPIGHHGLFHLYRAWAYTFLSQPVVWSAVTALVSLLPEQGVLNDQGALAAIARKVPPFDSKLFSETLGGIDEALRLGLLDESAINELRR